MGIEYQSVPIGSITDRPRGQRLWYWEQIVQMPRSVSSMLMAKQTGAFIRGLARQYKLPVERSTQIALAILRVATGSLPLAKLGTTLSSEMVLSDDIAKQMTTDIERDLFGPVRGEWERYLQARSARTTEKLPSLPIEPPSAAGAHPVSPGLRGASNVLNLKEAPRPPLPPPMPPARP